MSSDLTREELHAIATTLVDVGGSQKVSLLELMRAAYDPFSDASSPIIMQTGQDTDSSVLELVARDPQNSVRNAYSNLKNAKDPDLQLMILRAAASLGVEIDTRLIKMVRAYDGMMQCQIPTGQPSPYSEEYTTHRAPAKLEVVVKPYS